jgi:hypothetical protein
MPEHLLSPIPNDLLLGYFPDRTIRLVLEKSEGTACPPADVVPPTPVPSADVLAAGADQARSRSAL